MNRLSIRLSRAIFIGLVLILILAPSQYSLRLAGKINLSPVDPLVWLTAAAGSVHLWLSRGWKNVRPPPVAIMVFLILTTASVSRAVSRLDAVKDIVQLIEYFALAYLLFRSSLGEPAQRRTLIAAFLAVGGAVVLFGAGHYLNSATPNFLVRASFDNQTVFGGFLALLLPMVYALALYAPASQCRRLAGLAMVSAGLLIVLAGGTFIAVGISLAVISAMHSRRALAAYAVALIILLAWILPHLPRQNLWCLQESIAVYDVDGNPSPRYPEWQAATVMTMENPLRGVGIGNYQQHVGSYYGILPSANQKNEADSQNLYLVLAASLGWPGLIAFGAILLGTAGSALKTYCRHPVPARRGLAAGVLGSVLAFSINAIWAPLLVRGIGIPLVFILALGAAIELDQPD